MSTSNPHAFPQFHQEHVFVDPGMSLRDWFAGHALAGYMAAERHDAPVADYADAAEIAYAIADAMLAEREKVHQS